MNVCVGCLTALPDNDNYENYDNDYNDGNDDNDGDYDDDNDNDNAMMMLPWRQPIVGTSLLAA